jgi:hypothetical protein
VGLWREWNQLKLHRDWAKRHLAADREAIDLNMSSRRAAYYEKHRAASTRLLKALPVKRHELQPRIEWLRSLTHAFIAVVAHFHGEDVARNLVRRLFCAELSFGPAGTPGAAFAAQHPLNQIADMRALARGSTSSEHGAVLYTDPQLRQDIARFPAVPPSVVQAVRPDHAFREAQIILAYDTSIPPEWRDAPLDYEVEFVSSEVDEDAEPVESSGTGRGAKRRADRKMVRMRLVIFGAQQRRVLGIGQGRTEREAMDAAARHMVQKFYFRRFDAPSDEEHQPAATGPDAEETGKNAAGVTGEGPQGPDAASLFE